MLVALLSSVNIEKGLCNSSQEVICGFDDYDLKARDYIAQRWSDNPARSRLVMRGGPCGLLREAQGLGYATRKPQKSWPWVGFRHA